MTIKISTHNMSLGTLYVPLLLRRSLPYLAISNEGLFNYVSEMLDLWAKDEIEEQRLTDLWWNEVVNALDALSDDGYYFGSYSAEKTNIVGWYKSSEENNYCRML